MKVGKRDRGTCSTADIFAHEQSDTCRCYTENKKEFGLSLSWAPESMGGCPWNLPSDIKCLCYSWGAPRTAVLVYANEVILGRSLDCSRLGLSRLKELLCDKSTEAVCESHDISLTS